MPRYFKLGLGFVGLFAVACGLFVARSRLTATPVPAVPQPVPVTAAEVQCHVVKGSEASQVQNKSTVSEGMLP
jgi:hypothetical protein